MQKSLFFCLFGFWLPGVTQRAGPHFVSHSFCGRSAPSPLSLCSCSVSLCSVHYALCSVQCCAPCLYNPDVPHVCVWQRAPSAHFTSFLVSSQCCFTAVKDDTSAVKCPPVKSNSHGWRLLRLCLGPASLPLCLSASHCCASGTQSSAPPPSVKTNSHDWRLLHFKSGFTFLPTPLTPLSLRTNKLFHLLHTSSNGKSTKTFNALFHCALLLSV